MKWYGGIYMNWSNPSANNLIWTKEISNREEKEKIANQISDRIISGDVIGIGSGSTSFLALQAIGKRVKEEKIKILAIPTSTEIAVACSVLGLPTTTLLQRKPDWAFDGADEVDTNHSLIKGRGGALFLEKLVLKSSPENYILVDRSKFVDSLGEKFAVPIEIYPNALHLVETELIKLGATDIKMRMAVNKDGPVITEMGNLILDTRFKAIDLNFEKEIKSIPGVIESGLFIGYNVNIFY